MIPQYLPVPIPNRPEQGEPIDEPQKNPEPAIELILEGIAELGISPRRNETITTKLEVDTNFNTSPQTAHGL